MKNVQHLRAMLCSRTSLSVLAATLALASAPAQAIGLTTPDLNVLAEADLFANPGSQIDQNSGQAASFTASAVDQANVPAPIFGSVQIDAQAGSYADDGHVTAAYAWETGRGTSTGAAGFIQQVTNDTAGRVRVDYTFLIDAGISEYFGFFDYSQTLPRPDGTTQAILSLKVNNVTTVSGTIDGLFTTVADGNAPDGFVRNASYSRTGILNSLTNFQVNGATATWDQSKITVTLTELDPGQSFDFASSLLAGVQVTAAACTSSSVTGGAKLKSGRMLRHIVVLPMPGVSRGSRRGG